jgi:hypothetical protein
MNFVTNIANAIIQLYVSNLVPINIVNMDSIIYVLPYISCVFKNETKAIKNFKRQFTIYNRGLAQENT